MAAGPMRLFRFARRSFDVDETQTSIDSLGSDVRMGEDVDAAYLFGRWRAAAIGGVRVEIFAPMRTVLRSLLRGCKRLPDCN